VKGAESSTGASRERQATFLAFYMVAVTRALHYISSFVLLFLLSPADFGVMAVAMSFVAIMNSLTNFGVDSALISYQGDERHLLNDAWTLEIIKGLVLSLVLFLAAPSIASWMNQPTLLDILRVLSLAFIVQSGKNIGLVSERKRFNFKVLFKCELAMAVTSVIITTAIALLYHSPWAIALGYIAGWLNYFLLSYYLCDFKPSLSVNMGNFRSIISYSKWILVTAQINTSIENGINIFIGSQFGMSVLGQFERADMFTRKTVLQVGEVIWKIGLPSLSSRASDSGSLNTYYLSLYRFICFLVFPILMVIVLYLPSLVAIGQDRDWVYLERLLQVLGLVALLTMLTIPAGVLFQAKRVPEVGFKIALIRLAVIIITLVPAVQLHQYMGVAYSLLISMSIVFPISLYHVRRLIGISLAHHLRVAMEYVIPCAVFLIDIFNKSSIVMEILEIFILSFAYVFVTLVISKHARQQLAAYIEG
jgi:O-antigen/teichoic acid export membrane protein